MENILSEIKEEFNFQINNFNVKEITNLSKIIHSVTGNIYFSGVGKSGNIAKHCCDLLKCISYSCFFFDLLNSTHGNIGTMKNNDIIIMFSNSGNTYELINVIPLFKKIGIKTIGICCNTKSRFKELCDLTIITPLKKEISGNIDKIPTNSVMSHLIFCNILVSPLKKNISLDKYKENHISGNIGRNLLKIKDCLIYDYPKIIIKNNTIKLNDIFLEMTTKRIGCCFFEKENKELIGILTDGDIRKLLIFNPKLESITLSNINKEFEFETDLNKYLTDCKNQRYIPILKEKKIIGIIRNNKK